MFGINTLFNTPLAIEKSYLLSVIASLVTKHSVFKAQNLDHNRQELLFLENITAQGIGNADQKFPVVFNIIGPIMKYSDYGCLGTVFYGKLLKQLDSNPAISGIVLNIDSGGGMVSGTAELTNIIKNLETPTISYTSGYQCSAAQDIASGCDYHMASPYADLIGSIGTMLSYQDFEAMFEKWGAKIYELYAPQSTEKNQEIRELMKGNEELYKERLKQLTDDFIGRIKANYGEKLKDDGHVFKGKTYTPKEALEIGLIDELGTLEDALNKF
ncbi:S49 family peptidase [Riemerella columbipharyngis]|uniref:Protease-4 n=1 Tax=Riemerella columbipharyngis TaxID=1071918 RepID=A0A1G7EY72_9FLAO|nr:S49 family peptidase [Riemerella columbipharyngis]SDE68537.1 protease-4 [Riemerella columbipharyngis]